MKLIVGLGNPGIKYRSTKHNIGFEVVKAIAKAGGIKLNKRAHLSFLGKGRISGQDVVLALPQTYMNLSGHAVGELARNNIKDLSELIVICDDINLGLGRIRIKKQGSSGGHKGLESVIHTLARDDFARLRVGIATDLHRGDITGYVLSPFKRKDRRNVSHVIALARDAVLSAMEDGIENAMNKFNKRKAGAS